MSRLDENEFRIGSSILSFEIRVAMLSTISHAFLTSSIADVWLTIGGLVWRQSRLRLSVMFEVLGESYLTSMKEVVHVRIGTTRSVTSCGI